MIRLAVAGLVSLAPLVGAAAGAAFLTDPTASAPPANAIAAATALPGPGPLPALVPLALLKAHQGTTTLDDAVDLDEDGELDSDFEFIERGAPERAGWLRNRSVVGVRRTTPRHAGGALTP